MTELVRYGITYTSLEDLVERGVALEVSQYRECGRWSNYRPIDGQRALRKASVRVDGFCPYHFRVAE